MPDIDFQRIELNLIPKKGDEPVVFYASQYETTRPFIADLMWGETEFAPGDDCWAEIDIRKNDDNLVVITDDVAIDNNEVSVILPVQALTCIGKNLGQVKIYAGEDQLIAALNFILEVQPDPLAGGVTSETAIDNLTEQIEEITQQVIGDDYYDKTEVDDLLDDKADKSDTYTKSQVDTALNLKADKSTTYTKTQTDNLLNDKADKDTTYTKTQVDNALALKANSADLATVATTGDYDDLTNKPNLATVATTGDYDDLTDKPTIPTKTSDLINDSGYITETAIDDILPVVSVSGDIATFNVALERKLKTITVDNVSTIVTRCGKNLLPTDYVRRSGYNTPTATINNGVITITNYDVGGRFIAFNVFVGVGNTYTIRYSDKSNINGIGYVESDDKPTEWISYGTPLTNANTDYVITTTKKWLQIYIDASADNATVTNLQIEVGSVSTAYEPYNGTEYPVADIDDITTLNGVNNIFADVGDVSVQAYDTIQHYIDTRI